MNLKFVAVAIAMVSASTACAAPQDLPAYRLEKAFPGLLFRRPVDLQGPDDGSGRLFVAEQGGLVWVFPPSSSASVKKEFLDLRSRVDTRGNEEGLLGIAFHPDFRSNGYFYVNYTAASPDRTVVSRFKVSSDNPDRVDEGSELAILEFAQPYSNHNGGQIAFGPDGFLYIAVGDGGSAGDPQGNGQNRRTLLGSILRIDVDGSGNGLNYAIPADNPFAGSGQGFRGEIFAYGFRNPWRFCFDPSTSLLWAADVGQNAREEIDMVRKGGNYGWNLMEGSLFYGPGRDGSGLELPVAEYDHAVGKSITGGYFYRTGPLTELKGAYIYADFISGKLWALRHKDGVAETPIPLLADKPGISSFGTDPTGSLYVLAFDGYVYRISR